MPEDKPLELNALAGRIAAAGFAFVGGAAMRRMLEGFAPLTDWELLVASWDDLGEDAYEARQGRLRRRRHAVYRAEPHGAISRAPHQPHYQASTYNPLHGGIERWFEPIRDDIGNGPSLGAVLAFSRALFEQIAPETRSWHVELHQFRIEARPDSAGQPTPEGLHRDGVDYVLVLLIRRSNIASGTTSIHAIEDRRLLGSFTLAEPCDAALVDDARVYHGVTAVERLDPSRPGYRDVLVVTFRKA